MMDPGVARNRRPDPGLGEEEGDLRGRRIPVAGEARQKGWSPPFDRQEEEVVAKPVQQGESPRASKKSRKTQRTPLGIISMMVGSIGWIIGYRFTVDGILSFLIEILRFFSVNVTQGPTLPILYALFLPIGYYISHIEWNDAPTREMLKDNDRESVVAIIGIWLVVNVFDFMTTLRGIESDIASGKAITFVQVISSIDFYGIPVGIVVASIILTYFSEVAMKYGWKQMPANFQSTVTDMKSRIAFWES